MTLDRHAWLAQRSSTATALMTVQAGDCTCLVLTGMLCRGLLLARGGCRAFCKVCSLVHQSRKEKFAIFSEQARTPKAAAWSYDHRP